LRLAFLILRWPCLSQPSGSQTILLKAWLTGTRASLTNGKAGIPEQLHNQIEGDAIRSHRRPLESRIIGRGWLPYFDRYRSIYDNNSLYIELYPSIAMQRSAR
jgi:hypothetical protein